MAPVIVVSGCLGYHFGNDLFNFVLASITNLVWNTILYIFNFFTLGAVNLFMWVYNFIFSTTNWVCASLLGFLIAIKNMFVFIVVWFFSELLDCAIYIKDCILLGFGYLFNSVCAFLISIKNSLFGYSHWVYNNFWGWMVAAKDGLWAVLLFLFSGFGGAGLWVLKTLSYPKFVAFVLGTARGAKTLAELGIDFSLIDPVFLAQCIHNVNVDGHLNGTIFMEDLPGNVSTHIHRMNIVDIVMGGAPNNDVINAVAGQPMIAVADHAQEVEAFLIDQRAIHADIRAGLARVNTIADALRVIHNNLIAAMNQHEVDVFIIDALRNQANDILAAQQIADFQLEVALDRIGDLNRENAQLVDANILLDVANDVLRHDINDLRAQLNIVNHDAILLRDRAVVAAAGGAALAIANQAINAVAPVNNDAAGPVVDPIVVDDPVEDVNPVVNNLGIEPGQIEAYFRANPHLHVFPQDQFRPADFRIPNLQAPQVTPQPAPRVAVQPNTGQNIPAGRDHFGPIMGRLPRTAPGLLGIARNAGAAVGAAVGNVGLGRLANWWAGGVHPVPGAPTRPNAGPPGAPGNQDTPTGRPPRDRPNRGGGHPQ